MQWQGAIEDAMAQQVGLSISVFSVDEVNWLRTAALKITQRQQRV